MMTIKKVGLSGDDSENFYICKEGNKRYTYFIYDDKIKIISYDIILNKDEIDKNPSILDKYDVKKIANDTGYIDKDEVSKFINLRYEYYDNLAGKSTGDKYSEKIWHETMKKFDITYEEVTDAWLD